MGKYAKTITVTPELITELEKRAKKETGGNISLLIERVLRKRFKMPEYTEE